MLSITNDINPSATVKATYGEVTKFDGEVIEVKLGSEWSNGETLTITLGNVQTAVPDRLRVVDHANYANSYTAYTFETSSKARNGHFVRLKPTSAAYPQPRVRVGNILGLRTNADDAVNADPANDGTNDTLKRIVKVGSGSEAEIKTYPGEEHDFKVVFTAPGPMYGGSLNITLPDTDDDVADASDARISSSAGLRVRLLPIKSVSVRPVWTISYNVGPTEDVQQLPKPCGNQL